MQPLNFTVSGIPVPQPRHRVGAGKAGGVPRAYLPIDHPVRAYKALVRLTARQALRAAWGEATSGPVSLSVVFVLSRPQRLIWKKRPMLREPAPVKPDLDNLAKALKDALTGIIWVDDSQVVDCTLSKWYAAGGEMPHTTVAVTPLHKGGLNG